MLRVTLQKLHSIQGGVEMFLVASGYKNWNKIPLDGPLDSYVDFLLYTIVKLNPFP